MRVIVATPARQEFVDAVAFYDGMARGLGQALIAEFDAATTRIGDMPEAGSPYRHGTRRVLLHNFPFGLVYRLTGEAAEVIAFAHQRRQPEYWAGR